MPDSFEPPLEPMAFAFHIEQTLRRYAANELEHVLRHGSWPLTGEGRRLSELVRPPQTLATILASLAEAPRLARAIPFVSQLVSALSIPPRRLAHTELPIGGYADIVSRGQPEQLLPSQFALEMDEFTRRFAENELLYFRREEPPASQREELVLLLDQGVRTWGIVRSLLSAAALALVKQAARRKQQLWLAGTSNGGKVLEALGVEPRKLCQLIEASDLSANPGLALETVLESRSDGPRDVVLLTHPRNLDEPDVSAAGLRAKGATRLFSVAANAEGAVEFAEIARRTRRPLANIRVDLAAKKAPRRGLAPQRLMVSRRPMCPGQAMSSSSVTHSGSVWWMATILECPISIATGNGFSSPAGKACCTPLEWTAATRRYCRGL